MMFIGLAAVLAMGAYAPQSCFGDDPEQCVQDTTRCASGKMQACIDPGVWETTQDCITGECADDFHCLPKYCHSNAECPEDYFCASINLCKMDGQCNEKEDCLNPANNWSCSEAESCQKDDNYTYCEAATEISFCTGCVCN